VPRNPAQPIDAVLDGQIGRDGLSPEFQVVQRLVPSLGRAEKSRGCFRELLLHAQEVSKLFDARPVIEEYPHNEHNTMLGALASLATHHAAWIRPLQDLAPAVQECEPPVRGARPPPARRLSGAKLLRLGLVQAQPHAGLVHGRGHNIRTAKRLFILAYPPHGS
jgi:hypothetical protein